MIACDGYTIIGTAGLAFTAGVVFMSVCAAKQDKDREFREKMRARYGTHERSE